MKKDFKYSINQGLPGGANELKKFVQGSISITGYKSDSPDVNNDFNIIPSNRITMQGVNFPVLGVDDFGYEQMMMPGGEYSFPGNYVTEIPQMGKGGLTQWFAEEWTDVKTGKKCGRSGKEKGSRPYPACRPKKRVNETTPKTTSEMSAAEKAKFKREKTSGKRINYNHKRKEFGGEAGWLDQYQYAGETSTEENPVRMNPINISAKRRNQDYKTYQDNTVNNNQIVLSEFRGRRYVQPTLSEYVEPSIGNRILNTLASPMTALSNNRTGSRNPFDYALDMVNPFSWIQSGERAVGSLSEGQYRDAALNALGALPALGFADDAGRGLSKAARYATTQTPLKNTWKLNPKAYQYNLPENTMWRGLGQEGMEDAVSSGVFRSKQNVPVGYFPGSTLRVSKSFGTNPYFTPKFKTAATYGDNYLAEVPRDAANWKQRYARNNWSQFADRPIPVSEGRILQKDWLKGYKPLSDIRTPKKEYGGWLDSYQEGGHIIQPGETFYGIANKYGIPNQDLILANPDLNIDKIRPGQRIRVPESFDQSQFPVGYFETSDQETFNRKSKVYPAPKKEEPPKKELPKEEPIKISRELNNDLLLRQAFAESTFNPKAKSPAGYMGLAQIGDAVIKDYKKATGVKKVDPYDPAQNAQVQKWAMNQIYNSDFVNKEGQDPNVRLAKTLASYNWGKGNVLKHLKKQKAKGVDIYNSLDWVESLPKETRDYIHKIQLSDMPEFNKGFDKAIKDKQYKQYIDIYKKKYGGRTNWLDNYK